jgi:hypothetical protein
MEFFKSPPTRLQLYAFLRSAFDEAGKAPKYLICDKASQVFSKRKNKFKKWCKRKGVSVRYGKVGKHGSIAVIERFILSLKDEYLRRIRVALNEEEFRRQLFLYRPWYNTERPHDYLQGRTPDEVYFNILPMNERPRYETRPHYPVDAWCASPQAPVRGSPGAVLKLEVSFLGERKTLPVIRLRRVA